MSVSRNQWPRSKAHLRIFQHAFTKQISVYSKILCLTSLALEVRKVPTFIRKANTSLFKDILPEILGARRQECLHPLIQQILHECANKQQNLAPEKWSGSQHNECIQERVRSYNQRSKSYGNIANSRSKS